jgi:hypothetical protein
LARQVLVQLRLQTLADDVGRGGRALETHLDHHPFDDGAALPL